MDNNNLHLQQLYGGAGALGFPGAGAGGANDPRLAAASAMLNHSSGGGDQNNMAANSDPNSAANNQQFNALAGGQLNGDLMYALSKLQQIATATPNAAGGSSGQGQNYQNQGGSKMQGPQGSTSASTTPASQPQGANAGGDPQSSANGASGQFDAANFQNLLASQGMNPSAFMGGAGGANAGGAAGFLGFDMNALSMQSAAFNPYLFPFGQGSAGMVNPYAFPGMGGSVGGVGSSAGGTASSFHAPGAKNEIKLFVGGLQFQTQEPDLFQYFSQFGQVADQIVMRDKQTMRGRGFGFVKMTFQDEQQASQAKEKIIEQNVTTGHYILDKKVDVKSADDYQGKFGGPGGGMGGMMGMGGGMGAGGFQQPMMGMGAGGFGQGMGGRGAATPGIPKPNPYVIAETKNRGGDDYAAGAEITFKYPRSKIFVGGLDFKLTVEELKSHFQQYGEVVDACILKDIYTGQSRGFGFVTFKEEDVAQDLIHNIMVTTINGRKADIKKAEVKQGGGPGGFGGPMGESGGQGRFQKPGYPSSSGPATIPPYGAGGSGGKDDSSNSSQRDYERGGDRGGHHGGHYGGGGGHQSGGGHHGGGGHHASHGGGGHHRGGGGDFDRGDRRRFPFDQQGGNPRRNGGGGRSRSRSRSGSRGRNSGGGGDRRGGNMSGGRFGGPPSFGGNRGMGGPGGMRGGARESYGHGGGGHGPQGGNMGGRHREDSRGIRRRSRSR